MPPREALPFAPPRWASSASLLLGIGMCLPLLVGVAMVLFDASSMPGELTPLAIFSGTTLLFLLAVAGFTVRHEFSPGIAFLYSMAGGALNGVALALFSCDFHLVAQTAGGGLLVGLVCGAIWGVFNAIVAALVRAGRSDEMHDSVDLTVQRAAGLLGVACLLPAALVLFGAIASTDYWRHFPELKMFLGALVVPALLFVVAAQALVRRVRRQRWIARVLREEVRGLRLLPLRDVRGGLGLEVLAPRPLHAEDLCLARIESAPAVLPGATGPYRARSVESIVPLARVGR